MSMKFKRWVRYVVFKESIKETELNRILDRVSGGKELTNKERNFLDLYNTIKDKDIQDYLLLSKQSAFERIKEIVDEGGIVICNIPDRDGPIGLKVINMIYDWNSERVELELDKGIKHYLDDKYLYNIVGKGKNKWSLEIHDEYHEKAIISNKND